MLFKTIIILVAIMKIEDFFKKNNTVVVAFSGGVDSSVLLHMAKKYASKVYAVFVKSEFQPEFTLKDAVEFCKCLGVQLDIINVKMLEISEISSNPQNRCYYCKKHIFEKILSFYSKFGDITVIDGTNASDDIDDRPGYKALQELGILSPLRLCGYSKEDIRKYAKANSLSVWNKPSYSCLATRIPTGIAISENILNKTEKAEDYLMKLGFTDFRVRYCDGFAKIQVCKDDFQKVIDNRRKIVFTLSVDYKGVLLDLNGR